MIHMNFSYYLLFSKWKIGKSTAYLLLKCQWGGSRAGKAGKCSEYFGNAAAAT